MYTSCVGSFPLSFSRSSVERIAKELCEMGLTHPCYPQLRDFISSFLDPLTSQGLLERRGSTYRLLVENPEKLREAHIPLPSEALWFIESTRSLGLEFVGLRAPVTGPFTLASRIYLKKPVSSLRGSMVTDLTFVKSLASMLSRLIGRLEKLDYDLIVVDEPILSVVYGVRGSMLSYGDDEVLRVLDMLKPRKAMMGMHICGRISPALSRLLLKSNIILLDHEFKDSPGNFKVFKADELEKHGKLLSVGCISSRKPEVESVEEVLKVLNKAINFYSDRVYMAKPDCGFRGLMGALPEEDAYRVSIMKLKTIVKAVRSLK